MLSALRKFGNSAGVIIPKPLLSEIGAKPGDSVELKVEAGRLVIERARAHPRNGWAEDAKRLAEAGDDELVWPEFSNEGDESLEW
ncbi:MAG: AbrB/MazE/SpoVT family DNA-binding domain-containing protein [Hyphomicrobiales bacterium]|nr:AbrB/MazE/SpoVT family DNA-binding domain-containing protein [Hyphomicrobiales bacterium]MBV9517531.1 AbrB/MazE/SpoVT family DNA-binding domain-containing protein [Hyphomicrobiales bacterium]